MNRNRSSRRLPVRCISKPTPPGWSTCRSRSTKSLAESALQLTGPSSNTSASAALRLGFDDDRYFIRILRAVIGAFHLDAPLDADAPVAAIVEAHEADDE